MKKIIIYFISLFLICLINLCSAQTNVWIHGKVVNQKKLKITISNDSFFCYPQNIIATAAQDDSGSFSLKFNISNAQVVHLMNIPIYVTPGDSVFGIFQDFQYGIPRKNFFTGKNADRYNYFMKYDSLKRALPFKYFQYNFKNGPINYFDSADINKNILMNQLTDFTKKHAFSQDCKAYAETQIIYDYYDQILSPIVNKNFDINDVPTKYSLILYKIKLMDDNLVKIREYAFTARDLVSYNKLKYKSTELQIINNISSGKTKELLLTLLANSTVYSYNSIDSLAVKLLFNKIEQEITTNEYKQYFNDSKYLLSKFVTPFPQEAMLTTLIDSLGHKLTFKHFLDNFKNKIIVLDFWASWCGPCIGGMPKFNNLKNSINNAEVEFVFISLEETELNWRKSMNQLKIPGNHYWIGDKFNSAFAKNLMINYIPRYVIINKSGKIEKLSAPAPLEEDNLLKSQILKLLKQ